jgi:hypothetical protein
MSLQFIDIIPLLRVTDLRPNAVWLVFVDRSGSTYSYESQIRKVFQMVSRTAARLINFSFSSDIMQGGEVQMAITNLALVFRKASELILNGTVQAGHPLVKVFATDGCHNSSESLKTLYTLMAEMFMNARDRNIPVHLIIVAYGDYPVTWIAIITALSHLYGVSNRVDIIFKSAPTTVFNPATCAQIQDTHWNGQNPVGSYIMNELAAQISGHIGWTALGLAHLKAQNLSDEVNRLIAEFESCIHADFRSKEVPIASSEGGSQIDVMSLSQQDARQIPADALKRAIAAMTASPPALELFSSNGFNALLRYYIDKIAESYYYSPTFMATMAIGDQRKLITQGSIQLARFPLFLVDMIGRNSDCFRLIQLLINLASSKPALYNAICGFLTLIITVQPDAITNNYVRAKRIVPDAKRKQPMIVYENFVTALCDAISNTTNFLLVMTPELTTSKVIQSPEFYAFLAEILSQTGDTKTHWNVTEVNEGSWWNPRIVKTVSQKCILDLIIRQFTSMAKPFSLSCEQTVRLFRDIFAMQERDGYGSLLTKIQDISTALIKLQSDLKKDLDLPAGQDQAVQVSQYLMYGFGFQCEILLMQHRIESTGTADPKYVRDVLKSFRQLMEKILFGCTTSEEVNLKNPSVLMDKTSVGYFYLALVHSYFQDEFINERWFQELQKYVIGSRLDESCKDDPAFRKRVIQLLIDNGKINLHDKGAGVSHSYMMTQLLKLKDDKNTREKNRLIDDQNAIVKEYILKAFKIPSWIHQSISGLFQILGAQYSDLLSPLEAIERVMLGAQTFVLHRICDDLPNEMTIGAAIHTTFMCFEEDLITSVRLMDCMLAHAARPVPIWQRPSQSKDVCMHPKCSIRGLSKSGNGHTKHEERMLRGGKSADALPKYLLAKLIDFSNPVLPRLFPILAQIHLLLKMNPRKYQTFEAMFGPTESHLLYQWWKFGEESATMKLDQLIQYCSSQDKIVFLVKLSEKRVIYVRVSLDTMTITEIYSVTDNRFTENVIRSYRQQVPLIEKFIHHIFQFEQTYEVSMESIRIIHEISKSFMLDQILRMKGKRRPQITFQHAFQSLTISQKFKVRYALTFSALKTLLVNRLVPTGKERDPTQANEKLLELVHFYASPRQ